jgi:predicted phage terminase large subunit-like protein
MAGRGFGKTRVGAEWLAACVIEDPLALDSAVIAPTYADVKFTCFEGPAGLMSVLPPELVVKYNSSDMTIEVRTIHGGTATIRGFTAEKPERLRGPQHARIWCDELAAWQYGQETWDMAMMGLRLGPHPQILWTTTPKPTELVRKLTVKKDGRHIEYGSTYDNRANLPESFFAQLEQYEGTTLGRQELHGELIDPEEQGIIKRSWFRLWPAKQKLPVFDWIIMSLDTAYTEKTLDKKTNDPDPTACSVWGIFRHEDKYNVLLLDCWQDHLGLPALMERVKKELDTRYGDDEDRPMIKPLVGPGKLRASGRGIDLLIIEDKGSGISLRQMLDREGITAYAYNPGRADKLTRLHMVSHIFARGQVWLPESAKYPGQPRTWADQLVYQLCAFTGGRSLKHDDHVDACTQALRVCMDKNLLSNVKVSAQPQDVADPRPKPNPYAA